MAIFFVCFTKKKIAHHTIKICTLIFIIWCQPNLYSINSNIKPSKSEQHIEPQCQLPNLWTILMLWMPHYYVLQLCCQRQLSLLYKRPAMLCCARFDVMLLACLLQAAVAAADECCVWNAAPVLLADIICGTSNIVPRTNGLLCVVHHV